MIEGSGRNIPGCNVEVSIHYRIFDVRATRIFLFLYTAFFPPCSKAGTVDCSKEQILRISIVRVGCIGNLAALQKKHAPAPSQAPRPCPIMSHEVEVFTVGLTIILSMLFETVVKFYPLET
jgi:hypothetical protein